MNRSTGPPRGTTVQYIGVTVYTPSRSDWVARANAARKLVIGAAKLLTFFRRLARTHGTERWSIIRANGLLTAVEGGRIRAFHSQLAPEKLDGG